MRKVFAESGGDVAWPAADVEEGVETPVGGFVVVDDGVVELGVVVESALGVFFALVGGVLAECFFGHFEN